ncbi:MAG: ribose 5-phosphate isomerase B [Spirochaeta sp. LUC14_002_19_P3]|nr:MAG: ribose 5-phosphate isomerase B [Spirochaeta sp. LUC14_002_19_P3]
MILALASDHAGFPLKKAVMEYLQNFPYELIDTGTHNAERCDYPVYAFKACDLLISGKANLGLLFCGSGVGISIAANKVKGIRAVVCSDCYTAKLSREHNNANVLALGARVVGEDLAKMIVSVWLDAKFEGGRHQTRLDLITDMESRSKPMPSPAFHKG